MHANGIEGLKSIMDVKEIRPLSIRKVIISLNTKIKVRSQTKVSNLIVNDP